MTPKRKKEIRGMCYREVLQIKWKSTCPDEFAFISDILKEKSGEVSQGGHMKNRGS